MSLELRLLGTVQAHIDGQAVDLGSARQRCVLVALLADANHVVPTEQLTARVWGEDVTPHRATLYSYLSRLRSVLADAGDAEIVRRSGGYLIAVDLTVVDLFRFRDLVGAANTMADADLAAAEYEKGLRLWRGEAFAGLDTLWVNQLRAALEAERRAAELHRNELMPSLGKHADLLAELTTRATEHPLDERIARQLMLALHRAGRRSEALRVYQDTRAALVEELGLEPGPELHALHQRMLSGDAELDPEPPAGRTVAPRQLPADLVHFTGREPDLAELHRRLADAKDAAAMVITAIDGTAGVGKTSLAVHFGHQVLGEFPDGELYLDLSGHAPMTPAEALSLLLRGLGLPPEKIPGDEQEQAATYRSMLAGRRVLIVLDNAHSGEQVHPLLPGAPGCLVVITSRTTLSSIDNLDHLHLDVLSEQEALTLLAKLAGAGRVAQDPEAALAVVRMCARLPLAVRIAGARLAARPAWQVSTLAARLADEHNRLDELRVGDRAVRTSFAVSYQALLTSEDPVDAVAGRIFRLLGVLEWADMSVPIAAALLDVEQVVAQRALERLVDDHLLDSATPGRYHTHDLLRLYARDLAVGEESERDRADALNRALCCYLDGAEQANVLMNPMTRHLPGEEFRRPRSRFSLSSQADATAWTDAERANLFAVIRQALGMTGHGPALGVRLTATINRPFDLRGYWHDFIGLRVLAAETAERLGDKLGAAFAFQDLAWTYVRIGRSGQAIASAHRALTSWREAGDRRSEQACLNILGFALRQLDRFAEAIDCLEQAYTICQEIGHRYGQAATQNHLGLVHQRLRRFDDAIACHNQAFAINQELGDQSGQATALANLGWTHYRAGDPAEAIGYYQRSLTLARAAGDRYQEGESLWGLGQSHHFLGNYDQARTCWHRSIVILHEIGALTDEDAGVLRDQPVPDTPEIVLRNT